MTKSTEALAKELREVAKNSPYANPYTSLALHVQTLLDKAEAEARAECGRELEKMVSQGGHSYFNLFRRWKGQVSKEAS